MKTNFTPAQLAQPGIAEADRILKTCQHYGFCTSGCPTYVLLHDENDSPRGRIDLIREMLESNEAPKAKTVAHLDRCLSCMSCMTTCAVNVDYMHLADTAREHIEAHYKRPWRDRLTRALLAQVLPRPALFRPMVRLGQLARRLGPLVPRPLRPALQFIPEQLPPAQSIAEIHPAQGTQRWTVALLAGCVQPEISPQINASTIALLTRFGCEVIVPRAAGCCGSLTLHMGKAESARDFARQNVEVWSRLHQAHGLDAILTNASGCGTTVKDYGHLLKDDPQWADAARLIGSLSRDVSEWLSLMELPPPQHPRRHKVAYHDACSLRNVQKVTAQPRQLLKAAGFVVVDVPEAHFCCGSAGTYNLLQPDIAEALGKRKAAHISATEPQVVAAGNIGCITQIGVYADTPVVHTVELLDWAYGGALPRALAGKDLPELALEAAPAPPAGTKHVVQFTPRPAQTPPGHEDVGIW